MLLSGRSNHNLVVVCENGLAVCHPEVPAGQPLPVVKRREVSIPLPNGEAMPALLAEPETPASAGVLVVADIYGRSPFYENIAGRLAAAGFAALLPEYFFRLEPLAERTRDAAIARRTRLDENRALAELSLALDWLRSRLPAELELGTVGFCMGGTLVLDLTAMREHLATVCYYGFPAPPANRGPFTPPAPLEVAGRMRGPILGFWGGEDAAVGIPNVESLATVLADHGVEFDHKVYPGVGHGFLSASEFDPDKAGYDAACESWTLAIEFFRRRLTGGLAQ